MKNKNYYGYVVYENGDVFNKFEKPLKTNTVRGYEQIDLRIDKTRKPTYIHRLVALMFIPNPENKPCVNHKNGIKTDNRVENLEWCTHKENQKHAYSTGLNKNLYGENARNVKLTKEIAEKIRQKYSTGNFTHRELGAKFKVSHTTIGLIIRENHW